MPYGIKLHITGEFACFTRPEMKVERVSAMGIIVEDQRQQRAATLLQNVSYAIEAHLEVLGRRFEKDDPKFSEKDCSGKHRDIFKRPARKGQALLPAFGKSSPERAAPPLFVPHLEKKHHLLQP